MANSLGAMCKGMACERIPACGEREAVLFVLSQQFICTNAK